MVLSHKNNFNLLRMIAATTVIFSHAYVTQAQGGIGGGYAVDVFFSMSGFLIMGSLDRSSDALRYFKNRALRIFPGLIVCILVTVIALCFFSTADARNYFLSWETWDFFIRNITLTGASLELPGVFRHNPYPGTVNGSLWTLRFEVYCYIVVGVAAAFGLLKRGKLRLLSFAVAALIYCAVFAVQLRHGGRIGGSGGIDRFEHLGFCFLLGMFYATLFPRFRLKGWHVALTAVAAALLWNTPLNDFSVSVLLAAGALWLAYLDFPFLQRLQNGPDYSYGTYIYAFPIQQAIIACGLIVHPLLEAAMTFFLVLPVAAMTWHFVEKPMLKLKKRKGGKAGPHPAAVAMMATPMHLAGEAKLVD